MNALAGARVLSGIRPTSGQLHVGNYFGALRPFVTLQEQFPGECYYFVADLHTIGDVREPSRLRANSLEVAIEMLAIGLDPSKSTVYIQSDVPELSHLTWLLTAVTNDTDLLNLPHYREKRDKYAAKERVEGAPATYLAYPILQAADILFTAEPGQKILVPVGEDQRPHIEFTRDVARRFNAGYQPVFGDPTLPEDIGVYVDPEERGSIRIKGLDGNGKMGKSEGNAVYLDSSPEEIAALVRRGTTDPKRISATTPGDPDDCIGIYPLHAFVTSKADREAKIIPGCSGGTLRCTDCKALLSDNLVALFAPFRERKAHLTAHPEEVEAILAAGATRVRAMVRSKIALLHDAMGLRPYDPADIQR